MIFLKGYSNPFPSAGILSIHVHLSLIGNMKHLIKHSRERGNTAECCFKDAKLSNLSLDAVWEASHATGMQDALFWPLVGLFMLWHDAFKLQ